MRRKRNNRNSFYYKSNSQKKNSNEIKSVSTNVNKDNGKNSNQSSNNNNNSIKKIILSKNTAQKKENQKNIQLDKKRQQNFKKNKFEIKFKSKIARTIIPYKMNVFENVTCHICNKTINNMSNAIHDKDEDKKYHFECITADLRKNNVLKSNQRIVYVGSNSFAIIEDLKEDGKMKFKIIQKLQYGSKDVI